MKQSDFDKAMLVEFAVREVAGGSLEEMQAVIYCIRNRVRKGWHEGRWVDNIENSDQYSAHDFDWAAAPRDRYRLDVNARPYQRLLNGIDDLYYAQRNVAVGWDGKKKDEDAQGTDLESAIGTATYWQFLKRPVRPWFHENIVKDRANHPVRTQMGMMIFYK
jgi:hypothetical protein